MNKDNNHGRPLANAIPKPWSVHARQKEGQKTGSQPSEKRQTEPGTDTQTRAARDVTSNVMAPKEGPSYTRAAKHPVSGEEARQEPGRVGAGAISAVTYVTYPASRDAKKHRATKDRKGKADQGKAQTPQARKKHARLNLNQADRHGDSQPLAKASTRKTHQHTQGKKDPIPCTTLDTPTEDLERTPTSTLNTNTDNTGK